MNSDRPTKKQKELLGFIDNFIKGNGYGPSYREIMRALDYKSVSTVAIHINGLIARGLIRKKDNSARSIEVLATSELTTKTPPEQWLVDQVQRYIKRCASEPSPQLIDDAKMLVEALRILGYNEAYQAARQAASAILKP